MIVALAGGVGGARLANGLAAIRSPDELLIAVNVGDDFTHMGLTICPDIDTVTYTLAGLNDQQRGWGVRGETWSFMDAMAGMGGPDWFALGDRDLALHVNRTHRIAQGSSLTEVTRAITQALGIEHCIVPVSDDPIRSIIVSDQGELGFQDYFVRLQCGPRFEGIRFDGAQSARPNPALMQALGDERLEAIVICPSNPILSIAPVLAVPGITEQLHNRRAPCIAVSPFIGGEAIKGPAAKILREMGEVPGARAVARHYAGLVDAILCDAADPDAGQVIDGIRLIAEDTLMQGPEGQARLAQLCLEHAARIPS
jgi:LPPG:FO 2-phospho-L-lactate transferase